MGRPECDLEAGARPVKSRGVATGARGKEPRYSIGRWRAALAVALLFAGLAQPAAAQSVTRGPYLQLGTPTSITVKWRTDVATDSVVRYGFSPDSLSPFPPLERHDYRPRSHAVGIATEHPLLLCSWILIVVVGRRRQLFVRDRAGFRCGRPHAHLGGRRFRNGGTTTRAPCATPTRHLPARVAPTSG